MNRPIVVYLDSSDYSNLANPAFALDPSIQWFRSKLEQAVDGGVAVFPFSSLHVLETAHTSIEHRQHGAARADVIARLSGGFNLGFHNDLLFDEVFALSSRQPSVASALRNDGRWWPRSMSFIDSLRELFGPSYDKAFRPSIREGAPGLNRQARRAEAAKHRKKGRFTALGRDTVDELTPEVLARFSAKYGLPLSPSRDALLTQLLSGATPSQELAARFEQEFFGVERFVPFYLDRFDSEQATIKWLRSMSGNFANVARQIQSQALMLVARSGDRTVARLPSLMPPAKSGIARGLHHAYKDDFRRHDISMRQLEEIVIKSPATETPSIHTLTGLVDQWVRANISDPAHPRHIRDSDGVDMFHSIYMPHVDIYKCDGFVRQQLVSAKLTTRTRVVSSQQDLIDALGELVDERRAASSE